MKVVVTNELCLWHIETKALKLSWCYSIDFWLNIYFIIYFSVEIEERKKKAKWKVGCLMDELSFSIKLL